MNSTDASDARFLRACRRQPVDRTPVWIMRQAGRYLPEYRELREKHAMLEICRTPELACEATMQPLRRFDLDAAILFSDLLIPLEALGVRFDIVENKGPVLDHPVRDRASVNALRRPGDLASIGYVFEAVSRIKDAMSREGKRLPLIGFAGAPFTVAAYMIEGGPSRRFVETKLLMRREPDTWADLLDRLADLIVAYLRKQVEAGADAVQVFDSWVGCLGPSEYERHVLPATRKVFEGILGLDVPSIHFGTMNATIFDLAASAGGDVLGVDWRMPLSEARRRQPDRAVQGNLDPVALLGDVGALDRMIDEVLASAGSALGHIFNLGHGILPETPPENVGHLVDAVHQRTSAA